MIITWSSASQKEGINWMSIKNSLANSCKLRKFLGVHILLWLMKVFPKTKFHIGINWLSPLKLQIGRNESPATPLFFFLFVLSELRTTHDRARRHHASNWWPWNLKLLMYEHAPFIGFILIMLRHVLMFCVQVFMLAPDSFFNSQNSGPDATHPVTEHEITKVEAHDPAIPNATVRTFPGHSFYHDHVTPIMCLLCFVHTYSCMHHFFFFLYSQNSGPHAAHPETKQEITPVEEWSWNRNQQ